MQLTYNYGVDKYELGTAFGHIAIEVSDCAAVCASIKALGGTVTREGMAPESCTASLDSPVLSVSPSTAGPVKGGTTIIAFVQDPDGYKVGLHTMLTLFRFPTVRAFRSSSFKPEHGRSSALSRIPFGAGIASASVSHHTAAFFVHMLDRAMPHLRGDWGAHVMIVTCWLIELAASYSHGG